MKEIHLVTGNPNKLRELQAIFPEDIPLDSTKLDIPEIQGENGQVEEIVEAKLETAYQMLGKPVIVEDVSAELACLDGFPGPFVKFAEKRMGKEALWQMVQGHDDHSVTIRCLMGYTDGTEKVIVEGAIHGTVVEPRGENGFGFDFVFVPDGYEQTVAEMESEQKNQISHRALAARALLDRLREDQVV